LATFLIANLASTCENLDANLSMLSFNFQHVIIVSVHFYNKLRGPNYV